MKKTKKNGIFSSTDKRWTQLLEIAKPKEDGDSYIMDAKSQGIIVKNIQNPRNLTARSYLREAFNLYSKGEGLLKNGDYLKAYEYVLVSYLLIRIAEHVDYYSTIRALKKHETITLDKKQLVKLLKQNNKKLILISEQVYKLKEDIAHKLYKKNLEKEMQTINKKYNMNFEYSNDLNFPVKPKVIRKKAETKVIPFPVKVDNSTKIKELEEKLADKKYDLASLESIQDERDEKIKKVVVNEIEQNKKDIEAIIKELESLKKAA